MQVISDPNELAEMEFAGSSIYCEPSYSKTLKIPAHEQ